MRALIFVASLCFARWASGQTTEPVPATTSNISLPVLGVHYDYQGSSFGGLSLGYIYLEDRGWGNASGVKAEFGVSYGQVDHLSTLCYNVAFQYVWVVFEGGVNVKYFNQDGHTDVRITPIVATTLAGFVGLGVGYNIPTSSDRIQGLTGFEAHLYFQFNPKIYRNQNFKFKQNPTLLR